MMEMLKPLSNQLRRIIMTEQTFESALARLNEIIVLLEKNEVTLSEAATLYKEGQALLQFAQLQLTQFEDMIDIKGE